MTEGLFSQISDTRQVVFSIGYHAAVSYRSYRGERYFRTAPVGFREASYRLQNVGLGSGLYFQFGWLPVGRTIGTAFRVEPVRIRFSNRGTVLGFGRFTLGLSF